MRKTNHIRHRKPFIVISLLLLIAIVFTVLLPQVLFQSIPENSAVRQICVDELGQAYFVMEDSKLYVGGQNRDRFGFYETGFQWGLLYGLRNLASERPPVFFADRVNAVFIAEDGVLFTDLDGVLYYFGEQNHGKKEALAENVMKASQSSFAITCLSSDSTAYCITRDYQSDAWTPPQKLMDDVRDVAIEGSCIWLLQEDGHLLTVSMRDDGTPALNEKTVVAEKVSNMWTSRSAVLLRTTDGTYQVISCDDSKIISIRDLKNPLPDEDNDLKIIDGDLKGPYPGDYFLTEQGGVYRLEEDTPVFLSALQEKEAVGIAVGYGFAYVIFGDGSYQRIPFDEAA